jgi:hypothetical protein
MIESRDQVQIYESIMVDHEGEVTTGLIFAVRYIKDNQLLSAGFEKETSDEDIDVHGAAADVNFNNEGDVVSYYIALGESHGPYHVEVALRY